MFNNVFKDMSDDLVVADEEMLFLNGQDEVIDIVDGNMNGEPKSAEVNYFIFYDNYSVL